MILCDDRAQCVAEEAGLIECRDYYGYVGRHLITSPAC
jgi:hypothetical protein